jgi:hypothetical protein
MVIHVETNDRHVTSVKFAQQLFTLPEKRRLSGTFPPKNQTDPFPHDGLSDWRNYKVSEEVLVAFGCKRANT